jgi:hypothetical protein
MKRELPTWGISRGYMWMGKLRYRPIFTVRAPNQDDAIEIAAHRVNGIALLKATRVTTKPVSFFLSIVAAELRDEED